MKNNSTKVILDTNILAYSTNQQSPFYQECSNLLTQDISFFVPDRCLLEFYRVLTGVYLFLPQQAVDLVNFYVENERFTILYSSKVSTNLTFQLAKENQAKSGKIFDLNILAVALENEIDILCTKNTKDYPTNQIVQIMEPKEVS